VLGQLKELLLEVVLFLKQLLIIKVTQAPDKKVYL
jgi:hypothetical protein